MNVKRKILLVSSAFYPEISPRSFRATELAKEFFRQGHNVTVITKFRDHDYSEFLREYPVNLKICDKPLLPDIPRFTRKPLGCISTAISRILGLLFEYPDIREMFCLIRRLGNESDYDLMISFAVPYPVHWGVAWARTAKNRIARTWIADCGDPYMFQRLDRFRKPFYFKHAEKDFCRKCDYIVIPIEGMQNKFYPEFIMKIRVIPQGINFREIRLFRGEIKNDVPVFIFAGSVIPGKRDLSLLLAYLSYFTSDFRFIIYTSQDEWWAKYKDLLGEKLELRPYIDRLSLIYEMSRADFVVNVDTIYDKDSEIEAVPSKLIDYALCGRPILNLNSGSLDTDLVREFLEGNYSGQRCVDKSRFDIRKVAVKFLELVH